MGGAPHIHDRTTPMGGTGNSNTDSASMVIGPNILTHFQQINEHQASIGSLELQRNLIWRR